MKPVPIMPPGHEPLCGCMHTLKQHDVQGRCGEDGCGCKTFHFEGQAQMVIENPLYRAPGQQPSRKGTIEVPLLHGKAPPPKTWWQRFFLRRWIRNFVGVTADMEAGTTYMQLTTSNILHQARLLQGLRIDVDAANTQQNPVNEVVLELQRRLQYYESETGTGLSMSYRKLMSIDAKQRERDRKMAEQAELDAANKRIEERKVKLQTGEFIECGPCKGTGQADAENICIICEGSGIVPNPDYEPQIEESEYTPEGVKRHLSLEE